MADKGPVKGKLTRSAKPAHKAPAKPVVATAKAAAREVKAPVPTPAPVIAKPATPEVKPPAEVAKPTPVAAKPVTPAPAPAPVVAKIAEIAAKPVAKIASPVAESAPAALPPEKKGMTVMAATIQPKPKAAAEKVQLMIADFNDRAKAAFEKTAKAGEELTEFTKGNMEALAVSAKTAAKGAETLGQELADYGKKSFETATATMKTLATVKTPTELFQIQSDYAKSSFDSAVAEASKLSEAWLKLAGDIFQPISSRYALAAEKIKSAAL
ncbi:phasin family protein [Sphingomonas sp. SRS2]|uniref:phasin family protein n=1 Tax=Sphingomonas sp. SRS2 TaxID=133190 RepID=UPI00061848E4|nr:phasin family protein [Sphingomonas sp. SRS2]KKC26630.1 phasin family protein [Sphingomonas sp. SRS2]